MLYPTAVAPATAITIIAKSASVAISEIAFFLVLIREATNFILSLTKHSEHQTSIYYMMVITKNDTCLFSENSTLVT